MNETDNGTVFVSGSSGGIGFAIAREFVHKGWTVIINGRNADSLKKEAENIGVMAYAGDLTLPAAAEHLAEFLVDRGLRLSVVVHNLGGKVDGDAHPVSIEVLNRSFELNLKPAIRINNMLIEKNLLEEGARFFHISSLAAETGKASPCYVMAKSALNAYVRNMAGYYKSDVCFYGLAAGIVEHENSHWGKMKYADPKRYNSVKESLPSGRFLSTDAVAERLYYLAETIDAEASGTIYEIGETY